MLIHSAVSQLAQSATMVGCHNIIKFKHRVLSIFFDKSIVKPFWNTLRRHSLFVRGFIKIGFFEFGVQSVRSCALPESLNGLAEYSESMFAKSIGNFGSPKSLTINYVLKFPVCGLKQEILKLRPYDNYFRYKKQEVAFRLHYTNSFTNRSFPRFVDNTAWEP